MASIILFPCQPWLSPGSSILKKHKLHNHHHHCCHAKAASDSRNFECKNKLTSSISHRNIVGVPLYELPWASFDQYMEDKGRVIKAIFPEESTSQQLNEEEWRVKMIPMQFLYLTCQPVVHITARCISESQDYPPEIPDYITKLLEFHITSWCELEDLHADYKPLGFNLNARGALYLERQGRHKLLKNQLDISLSLAIPPILSWVPEHVSQNNLQSVLRNYTKDINNGFAVRVLADYNAFKKNMPKNSM